MMIDGDQTHSHNHQSSFLQYYNSESGQNIRNKNLMREDSCWTDSQKKVELTELTQRSNLRRDIDERQKSHKRDNSIIISPNKVFDDTTKIQRFDSFLKQLSKQKTMLKLKNPNRCYNLNGEEASQKADSIENFSFLGGMRLQVNQDDENQNFTNSFRKAQTLNLLNEHYQQFKNKIAFISKIKIQMTNFYKKFTSIHRNRSLNKQVRVQINDLSDIIPNNNNPIPTFIQSTLKRNALWKYYCNFPLFDPQDKYGFQIKSILVFLNFIYFFVFSLIIVFQVQDDFERIISNIIKCIWVVEIVINLNFKVYQVSSVICKRTDIFFIYLKNKSLFDFIPLLIALLPYFDSYLFIILQLFQFIKIHNLLIDLRNIYQQLYMRVRNFYWVQLFNLVVKLFVIAHIISCIWYLLGLVELKYLGEQETWFSESVGVDLTWWKLYLASLYWSLTLMTTGSNTSTTLLQTLFTSFIMLFISIAFGYILNVIGLILSEMDKKDENKRRDISIINEYMRKRNISKQFYLSRVNLNLIHFYEKNFKQEQIENFEVLGKISAELKDSLLVEYNKQILSKIDFLSRKFSEETLQELSLYLKEEYYFPNQVIYFEKDVKDQSLMFIVEGQGNKIN